jgi:hypothetical protein
LSAQPSQNRRVHLYEVSGNARIGALFNIVKLTKALYYKHFADPFEYSLPPGFDRCEVVARYSSDLRQFVERHFAAEPALDKPQRFPNAFHIDLQRSGRTTYQSPSPPRLTEIASESEEG